MTKYIFLIAAFVAIAAFLYNVAVDGFNGTNDFVSDSTRMSYPLFLFGLAVACLSISLYAKNHETASPAPTSELSISDLEYINGRFEKVEKRVLVVETKQETTADILRSILDNDDDLPNLELSKKEVLPKLALPKN